MPQAPFTPKLFAFLRGVRAHNDREWFAAHKSEFEAHVRDPFLAFIRDVAPGLKKISRHLDADPAPVGGSLFRIYRDTRFSADKSPYKTHAGAQFRHRSSHKDVHGPGYYLHLEPARSFLGGGMWHPDPPALHKIRTLIAQKPALWRAAVGKGLVLEGESVKRPPKGFDPEHALIEDLKRKDFIATVRLPDREITSPGFEGVFLAHCRTFSPLMSFLARANGMPW